MDEEDQDVPCDEAFSYLRTYGIEAEVLRETSDEIFTPDIPIRTACKRRDVALCIMGAYGHSRLKENIFGGVTRRMLVHTECPLMIAH
ncbi:universal stress protein [Sphingomonas sp. ID1715]|uniref:universal stress protein n=1 Tax=Sphingomonas sp. ID1715 TaxID=1656898 RepID=UPI001487BDD9|nr:universal stress protein [Sphingomonas sp. ID1715]